MDQNKVDVKVDIGVSGAEALRDASADVGKLGATSEGASAGVGQFEQALGKLEENLTGAAQDAKAAAAGADQVAAASARAGKATQDAFAALGVRSAAELRAEIDRIRAAMETVRGSAGVSGAELARAMATGSARVKELERDLRAATGQLTLADRAAGLMRGTMAQFAAGTLIANGISSLMQRVSDMGRGFLEANTKAEALRRGLTAIYGDAATASAQMDRLRATASRYGVAVGAISESFVKFSASAQAARVPITQVNELFDSLVGASATLGLSGERVSLMLDALGQMAGKGVVSMEELRQQLGDSLPGALSLTAKGLGLTEQELIKLVEGGGLLARDLFPALAKSLRSLGGEADTMTGTWEGLKNAMALTATTIGDTGVWDVLKLALKAVAVPLGALAVGFSVVTDAVLTSVKVIASAVAAITTGDFTSLSSTVQKLTEDAVARQVKLIDAYKTVAFGAERTTEAHAAVGRSAQQAGQAAQAATTGLAANTQAQQGTSAAATVNAQAQASAGTATTTAGQSALAAAGSWVQLGVRYEEVRRNSEQMVGVKERLAKATQVAGQASTDNARMSGNERVALSEAAFAAINNAKALGDVARARNDGARAMESIIAGLVREAALLGDPDGSRAKDIAERKKGLETLQAEATQATQAAEAAKSEAAARTLARQAYEDNTAALGQLKTAMEQAREADLKAQAALRAGLIPKEQADEVSRRAAAAEGLYNDALQDSQRALERNAVAIRNKNSIAQATIDVDLQRARNAEQHARALGDEAGALDAVVKQRELHIRSVQASAEAQRQEAEEAIAGAERYREELQSTGQLTTEKEAEIQARIDNAKAKQIEAAGSTEVVKGIQNEIDAIKRRQLAALGGAAYKPNVSVVDQNDGRAKSLLGDSRGDRLAGQNAVDNRLMFALRDKLNAGSLTEADLGDMRAVVASLQQNAIQNAQVDRHGAGQISLQGRQDDLAWQSTMRRLQQAIVAIEGKDESKPLASAAPTAPAPASTTYVSNVDLGDWRARLKFADRDSQKGHEELIRRLLADKGVSL